MRGRGPTCAQRDRHVDQEAGAAHEVNNGGPMPKAHQMSLATSKDHDWVKLYVLALPLGRRLPRPKLRKRQVQTGLADVARHIKTCQVDNKIRRLKMGRQARI